MVYIDLDQTRPLDIVLLGRIAIDFNPAYSEDVKEDFKPLKDVHYFEKYVGGSPANIAVGVTHHGLAGVHRACLRRSVWRFCYREYFDEEGYRYQSCYPLHRRRSWA